MEWIRNWVLGVTCAAMVAAAAQTLIPKGAVGRISRFTGGLLLLLAVVGPVFTLDESALSQALARWRESGTVSEVPAAAQVNGGAMEALIAQEAGAYIAGKAASLGAACTVEVEVRTEGEYPVPWSVEVTGELTEAQKEDLSWQIEADFAIPEERQTYRRGEGGAE